MSIQHACKAPFKVMSRRLISTFMEEEEEIYDDILAQLGIIGAQRFSNGSYGVIYRRGDSRFKCVRIPEHMKKDALRAKLYNNR